jgi:phosphoglycerate dehydrogenase-like enzyme
LTTVVVASFFEEEFVRRFRGVDDRLEILYRPELVPPPRWEGDHNGPEGWERTPGEEEEFLGMLAEAEVLYDFPRGHVGDLMEVAPKLRWVQGSMAGAGEVARSAGLLTRDEVVVTTASGIYSGPLAEFVLMGMLQYVKGLDLLRRDKAKRTWRQGTTGTLERKTLCVVGTGSIGRAIADRARPFGMRVVGVKRAVRADDAAWNSFDELYETKDLGETLGLADFVALTLPGTPQTEGLFDAQTITAIKPGAYFANVGRGRVVEEAALVEALQSGHLSGAALDVFEVEPLPEESPLWGMDNVIISAHTTDVVPELINAAQADLFCENLRRYLAGDELLNVLDKRLLY